MSQHDLSIANQTFPATRTDLNNALQALGSLQSGTTAPATTYANMLWYDTTNNVLKLRNEDNDAWIEVVDVNQSTDVVELISKLKAPDGSASTPSMTFDADQDTGIYRVGTNQIGISTGGTLRLLVDSDGDVTVQNGTPALRLKDVDSTGSSQVGEVQFVDSSDSTKAQIGYLSGSNTQLSIKNSATGGDVRVNIGGTDRITVASTGASVTGTLGVSGLLTASSGANVTGTVTATAFSGDGSGLTGLPTINVGAGHESDGSISFSVTTGSQGKALITAHGARNATYGSFGNQNFYLKKDGSTLQSVESVRTMEYDGRLSSASATVSYVFSGTANTTYTGFTFESSGSGSAVYVAYQYIGV